MEYISKYYISTCINYVNLSAAVKRHITRLHEAFFFGPATSKRNQGWVVIRHIKEKRAVFNWPVKNQNLKVKKMANFDYLRILISKPNPIW